MSGIVILRVLGYYTELSLLSASFHCNIFVILQANFLLKKVTYVFGFSEQVVILKKVH